MAGDLDSRCGYLWRASYHWYRPLWSTCPASARHYVVEPQYQTLVDIGFIVICANTVMAVICILWR